MLLNNRGSDKTFIGQYERLLGVGRPSGHQYIFYCPFPGCAGYRQAKLYVDPQTGHWLCFHCQQAVPGKVYRETSTVQHGGTWRDFVRMMGDEANTILWPTNNLPTAFARTPPLSQEQRRRMWGTLFDLSSLTLEHALLLRMRGLDAHQLGVVTVTGSVWWSMIKVYGEETCVRAGLARIDDETSAIKPTLCVAPGRILIPFFDGRYVDYFVGYSASHSIRYAGPTGYSTCIYGVIPPDCELLIVTEGQFKAAAAAQRGYPCIGLQGMGNNHRLAAQQCRQREVQRVVILFDTQKSGQETVDQCAERLAREMLRSNIAVYQGYLPLSIGEDKVDVDSFFLSHTKEEFENVLMDAIRRPYRLG